MKKILSLLSLALIFLMADINSARASHASGADISWTYTGTPNTYVVRVKFYRDCAGIAAPTQIMICYNSNSCGQNGTAVAPIVSSQVLPNPPCVLIPINCAGGQGVEEYIYETTITLPQACTDWVFDFAECCRNNAITTITGANGYNLYLSATLDNLNWPTDNSPQFISLPYTSFCVGNPFYFDQQAFDIDGDSLVYSLVNPLDGPTCGPGVPITSYAPAIAPELPLSATQPVFSTTPVTISQNGVVYFIPTSQQVAVLAVECKEYDPATGALKGRVRRDIQINVTQNCNYIIPVYPPGVGGTGVSASGIQSSCGDNSFIVPFGTEFQCGSAVPSDFRVLDPFGFANPVVSIVPINCINGKTDSVEVFVLHTLTSGTSYVWTKMGSDGNTLLSECGLQQPEDDTIQVKVTDNFSFVPATDSIGCLFNQATITLTEDIFCFSVASDGSDISFIDGGTGLPLPVQSVYGYCGPGGDRSNQILITMNGQQSILGPAYLIANVGSDNNTLADDCGSFVPAGDTIAILYVNNEIPVTLGSDLMICDAQTPFTLNSGYVPPASFTWSLGGTPIGGANGPQLAASASGTYAVEVYSSATCRGSDTIVVDVLTTPDPDLGSDQTFCQGGSVPVLDPLVPTPNNYNYAWFYNNSLIFLATGPTYTPPTTQYGCYAVEISNQSVCVGYDTVCYFSVQPPIDVLSAQTQTICEGASLPNLDAGNTGAGSYQWSLNSTPIPGANSQYLQVTNGAIGTYTYSVYIESGGVCNGTFSMTLTIDPLPVVSLSNQSVCIGSDPVELNAGNPGMNYSWIDVTNGNVQVGNQQNYFIPTSASGTITYTVIVTSNGGCSASSTFDVTINPAPTVTVNDDAICVLDPPAIIDASNSTGTSFAWSTGATTSTITANTAGQYTVTVTSSNGCTATDVSTLTVEQQLAAPAVNCGPGNETFKYIYTWTEISGNTGYEVSEDGGVTWIAPINVGGAANTHGTSAIILNLLVHAINDNGLCREGISSEPVVCAPVLPNIITANGDNKNDAFIIGNIEFYPNNKLTVFNRWGKEVYSKSTYNNKDNVFKGDDLPEGSYFVILDLGDGRDAMTGTLTIAK